MGSRNVGSRSTATELREAIDQCVERFESSDGVSADPYSAQPTYHAMGEAEYILTLYEMRRAGLVAEQQYEHRLEAAVHRLKGSAILPTVDTVAWGLGFPHGNASENEPYVVTTALVVSALRRAAPSHCEPAQRLRASGIRWLDQRVPKRNVKTQRGFVPIPQYSPMTDSIVTNAVAKWAASLAEADEPIESDIDSVLAWLEDEYQPRIGWAYGPSHPRVDLLHQCYILCALGAVRGFSGLERLALDSLTPFFQGPSLIDKFDALPIDDAIVRVTEADRVWFHADGETGLVVYPDAARPWAVGALLVLCTQLEREGKYGDYWQTIARRSARIQLHTFDTNSMTTRFGLRQTMHLAHGFAALLRNLRLRPSRSDIPQE